MSRNNENLKRLCTAMQISDKSLVNIMASAGFDTSRSRANGWLRGADALKKPDAGSQNPGNQERRMKIMEDNEFDAFCEGIIGWMRDD